MFVVQIRSSLSRVGARHRWLRPILTLSLAAGVGWFVAGRVEALEQAERAWGDSVTVWVTDTSTDRTTGPLTAHPMQAPVALVPEGAVTTDPSGRAASHPLAAGAIVTRTDLVGDHLPGPGRRGVAVPVDDTAVPLGPGDHVDVVAAGQVLAADATVMSVSATSVVVAVDEHDAAAVAAATVERTAVLVLASPA
ncbi:MAG: hypothetical protein U0Q03_03605 [Acidimicrobiales bacterium]